MHPKWLHFRYKLFRYRHVEQAVAQRPHVHQILDIGCGDGENLLRFKQLPVDMVGVEISLPRLVSAKKQGLNVLQADGTYLPFPSNSYDMIYIAHVLHHVPNFERVLAEIARCLAPGGTVFVIETVTDNPLLRFGRRVHPYWQGDATEANWDYEELVTIFKRTGFKIEQSDRYNLFFFLWEMFPLRFWPFELFTPIFVYLDLLLEKILKSYAAHSYFVLSHTEAI